jgi:hypothetical protein
VDSGIFATIGMDEDLDRDAAALDMDGDLACDDADVLGDADARDASDDEDDDDRDAAFAALDLDGGLDLALDGNLDLVLDEDLLFAASASAALFCNNFIKFFVLFGNPIIVGARVGICGGLYECDGDDSFTICIGPWDLRPWVVSRCLMLSLN